jgi:hypothetical protein
MDEHVSKGISRRSMLRRVGAGAAVTWSAPILTSLRAPAFAQGTPPPLCEPGACPRCQFGPVCGNCACVGVPVECFCTGVGICQHEQPICREDSDCDVWCGGPGGVCAECVFVPECMETSCWCPCANSGRSIPRRKGVRVIRPR